MHCHCIFIFRGASKPENRNAVSNDPTFNFLVHKKSNSSVIVHLFNQCFYTLSIKHVSFHQENCHSSLHKQCVATYKLRVEVSSLGWNCWGFYLLSSKQKITRRKRNSYSQVLNKSTDGNIFFVLCSYQRTSMSLSLVVQFLTFLCTKKATVSWKSIYFISAFHSVYNVSFLSRNLQFVAEHKLHVEVSSLGWSWWGSSL